MLRLFAARRNAAFNDDHERWKEEGRDEGERV